MPNQTLQRRIRCTATTNLGKPCRSWAVHGTDPPRCVAHGGGSGKHGAPRGNKNAVKHGFYADGWAREQTLDVPTPLPQLGDHTPSPQTQSQTMVPIAIDLPQTIAHIIHDLYNKHCALSDYIDQHAAEMSLPEYSHLLALHAQMASRLGRLLRDQIVISPELHISDPLQEAMRQAYEQLSIIHGTDLT